MIETEVIKQESIPPVDVGSKNEVPFNENNWTILGNYLQDRLKKIKTLREGSDWEKEKQAAFNAYHMVPKMRSLPFPGAANLSCPFPRIGVDAFHANVMASLFADGTNMKLKPKLIQKDYAHTADKAARYMTFAVNSESNLYMAVDDADKKAQMFGVGYLEPSYIKEQIWETVNVTKTERIPVPNPVTGKAEFKERKKTTKEKKKKVVFDGVKVDSLPVMSIFVSPFLRSIKDAVRSDVVFKVFNTNYSEIVDRTKSSEEKQSYYRKDQVEKIKPSIKQKIYQQLNPLEQARADKDGFYFDYLGKDEVVELAEAYVWYDIDGDDIKEQIRVTFHPASGTVLRVTLSPCRIVELVPRPIDDRFPGEGIPAICESISDEWETFHNTRANAGQWENTTFGFYRAGGRFNPQTITIAPGRFYPVDDPREVVFAQPPRVGSSYFQEESMLLNYFERIFALDENMQGVESKDKSRTATESINISSRASIRFGNPFNRIANSVNELLDHIWELNQECAPEEKEFYVVGTDGNQLFDQMTKYDYSAKLRFSVVVSSIFDQQLLRDTMMLAYRLFMSNPAVQQHPELMWELSQKTLDRLNIDIELPKPDQAKTLSPYEEHEMFKRGEDPEPQVGEDYEHHLKTHMTMMNHEDISDWEPDAVMKLAIHIDKTKILKQTLESANLNKSGIYTGPMPQDQGKPQPKVTSNRNPTQMFNTMKVGESGNSAKQNLNQTSVPGEQNVQ